MLIISHNLDKKNLNQLKTVTLVLESVYNRVHKQKTKFLDQVLEQVDMDPGQEKLILVESIKLMTDSFQSEIQQDFVLCLQEVTVEVADFVEKTLNSSLYCEKSLSLPESNSYNLIASNQPILNCKQFYLSNHNNNSLWSKKQSRIKPRQAIFCDFDLHLKNTKKTFRVRVFNIHLEVYCPPQTRINQLNNLWQNTKDYDKEKSEKHKIKTLRKQCSEELDTYQIDYKTPNYFIIAGDWNTFSYFPLSLLIGWAFDYKPKDYFVDEQSAVKKWLEDRKMIGFFDGRTTYPRFGSSLDKIVLSENLVSEIVTEYSSKSSQNKKITKPDNTEIMNLAKSLDSNSNSYNKKQAEVIYPEIIKNTFGSDHYPIFVHISDDL